MNKVIGYIIMITGMIGVGFFVTYHGNAIPLKELWFVLSLTIVIIGAYVVAKDVMRRSKFGAIDDTELLRIQKLKSTGEKVLLTPDNCEVRTRSYVQDRSEERTPTRTQMVDGIFAPGRNYQTQEIVQTYIFLQRKYDNRSFNFYSPPVTIGEESLRIFLSEANSVFLYIDKQDQGNYYFDFRGGC